MTVFRMPDEDLWPRRDERLVREELIRRNLTLAQRLASRFRNPNEPMEDLVQVAGMALVQAVDRLDHERQIPFSAFAIPTILGELKKHFRDTAWALHVPRGAAERAQLAQRAADELTDRHGRSPTVAELAAHLEMSFDQTIEALDAASARYALSLDASTRSGDDQDGVDLIETLGSGDDGFDLVDARLTLVDGLRGLPLQELWALQLRLELDLTQTEIADHLGCSQMHVSRLLRRALERLRQQLSGSTDTAASGEPALGGGSRMRSGACDDAFGQPEPGS
jgi:RNA polymerase sigma-B factor